ncbi:MAG: SWIM zinc finger domain-containing protein [Rhodanobacter sp.]|jgi:hypothetical protein|nr:SWIM zinc finger domain-containing protein [Rhodanobacter sp.]
MAWFDGYRGYDDATLTSLANAGLLRRAAKDIEAGKVEWAEQSAENGVITADGQRVQLDARGPQQARCDCPAPGICKHILGAVLWLRGQATRLQAASVPATHAQSTGAPTTDVPPTSEEAALVSETESAAIAAEAPGPLAEVLALDSAALFKTAGVAAVRRAAATPIEALIWREQDAVLVLELPELGAVCRWVAGAGFAGMISEIPATERKAVHLIALAALRREHGRPLEWPTDVQPMPVARDNATLGEREQRFLEHIEALLHELLSGGLAHVSDVTSARLLALNMSARGEGLPRLAALLRNLGGIVDLLAKRDHRAQERDALALMARIYALCAALRSAQGGELATVLRGRLQRDFDATGMLDVLPLGAHWWQTRGGARGLSLAFWDSHGQRIVHATLARPDGSDTRFTRHTAWGVQALWPGAGTAQRICEGALRLEQARIADDGRIALGGAVRAQMVPAWKNDDPRIATLGYDDWAQLAEQLRASTGLTGTAVGAVLLRPGASQTPRLDEVRQRLDWPVRDMQGRWLILSIPCGTEHRERIDNLDRLIARGVTLRAVLARVDRSGSNTMLMPVAVLVDDAQKKILQTISLDFAQEPVRKTTLTHRIFRMFQARQQQPPAVAAPMLGVRLLAPVIEVIQTQAETGRMPLTAAQTQALQTARAHIASVGLDTLSDALEAHLKESTPRGLLRLSWLSQLLTQIEGLPLPE